MTSLLIASKYEEIYPPELKDFVFITDKAYTKEDVLQMEFMILSSLSFDITFPTMNRFLERYMKLLGDEDNSCVTNLAYFMIDLSLIDIRMTAYPASCITASAICYAYKTVQRNLYPHQEASRINEQGVEHFVASSLGFSESDLSVCMKELYFL